MAVSMDHLSVAAGEFPGTDLACPNGWNCTDVGAVSPGGGQTVTGGQWSVFGGGPDIWTTADAFHYDWQPLATNGTVSAQVTSLSAADPFAKAGVMVRASTDPGSAYYAVYVTPGNGIVVQDRTAQGATAVETSAIGGTAPMLVRAALNFPAQLTPTIVGMGLGLSTIVGIAAGYWPARNASNLAVVDALRDES